MPLSLGYYENQRRIGLSILTTFNPFWNQAEKKYAHKQEILLLWPT